MPIANIRFGGKKLVAREQRPPKSVLFFLEWGMWIHQDEYGFQHADALESYKSDTDVIDFMVCDIHLTDMSYEGVDIYDSGSMTLRTSAEPASEYSNKVVVYVTGVSSKGVNICARVNNFRPVVRFLLAYDSSAPKVVQKISQMLRDPDVQRNVKWVRKMRTDGFHADENGLRRVDAFMEVSVNTLYAYNLLCRFDWEQNFEGVRLSTRKRTPLIQFTVFTKIKTNGWCEILKYKHCNERHTHDAVEVACSVEQVRYKECEMVAPFVVASLDIETFTESGKQCKAERPGDCIFMIGTTFWRFGDDATVCKKIVQVVGTCTATEHAQVLTYETEKQLLNAWCMLVTVTIPVRCFIGYNIFLFDFPYMFKRAEMMQATMFPYLSRIINHRCRLDNIRMESEQTGKNALSIPHAPGVFCVDMWYWIKLNKKFDSYSLNAVSELVLGESKEDLDYKVMMQYWKAQDPDEVRIIADYNIKDTLLPLRLMSKFDTLVTKIGMSRVTCTSIYYLVASGQQRKVFNLICCKCEESGFEPMQTAAKGTKYQGAYVVDPCLGIHDMISVLDFASLYPSIMIAHNICFSTLLHSDPRQQLDVSAHVIKFTAFANKTCTCPADTFAHDKSTHYIKNVIYVRRTDDNVLVVRHDMPQPARQDWDEEFGVSISGDPSLYTNSAVKKNAFVQNVSSILPEIVKELLHARKLTRQQMATEKNPSILANLNGRQLALKVSANSVYGFTGVREGIHPCQEVAETVTKIARESIQHVIRVSEQKYDCRVIYGDTDSVMLQDNATLSMEECHAKALRMADEISMDFRHPMKLEFEKIYSRYIISNKKRYAGTMFVEGKDGKMTFEKIDVKGLETARRGTTAYAMRIYDKCLSLALKGGAREISTIQEVISDGLRALMRKEVPISDLVMTKSLGDDYKRPESQVQLSVTNKIRDRDDIRDVVPSIGDRVRYVIVRSNDKLLASRGEHPEYAERNNIPLDYVYYAEKQLMKPIRALFEPFMDMSIFDELLEELKKTEMSVNGYDQGTISESCLVKVGGKRVPTTRMQERKPKVRMQQATLF